MSWRLLGGPIWAYIRHYFWIWTLVIRNELLSSNITVASTPPHQFFDQGAYLSLVPPTINQWHPSAYLETANDDFAKFARLELLRLVAFDHGFVLRTRLWSSQQCDTDRCVPVGPTIIWSCISFFLGLLLLSSILSILHHGPNYVFGFFFFGLDCWCDCADNGDCFNSAMSIGMNGASLFFSRLVLFSYWHWRSFFTDWRW